MKFKDINEFYEHLINDYKINTGSYDDKVFSRKRNGIDGHAAANANNKVRQSILYRYFMDKKKIKAEEISKKKKLLIEYRNSKNDKYILLHGAYLAYKNKKISYKDYKEIFLEANACSKSGPQKRAELFDINPDKAREQLEERLLRDCAERFIDNAQKRRKKASSKSEENSYTDVIEMLSQYSIYTHDTNEDDESEHAGSARTDLSEEYIEKCADLYEIVLSEDDMNDVFIPLYVDNDSGAGVYIIGEKFLGSKNAKVCILSFEDMDMDYIKEELDFVKGKDDEDDTISIATVLTCMKFNNVKKAFYEFGQNTKNYFSCYHEFNGELPDGADNCFKSRFFDRKRAAMQEDAEIKQWKKNGEKIVP